MINLFLVLFLLGLGLTFWILLKRDPKIETPKIEAPKIEEEPTNVFPILVEITPKKKSTPKMSPAKKPKQKKK